MTTNANTVVQIQAGAGQDFIDARGVNTYRVLGLGEDGNDTLIAGDMQDSILGGAGDDALFADGDGINDQVFGGPGFDKAKVDVGVDQLDSLESFPF